MCVCIAPYIFTNYKLVHTNMCVCIAPYIFTKYKLVHIKQKMFDFW